MEQIQEKTIEFIETDLIPEMVHNRCFCESGSREFVELSSVSVEPLKISPITNNRELYRGQVVVKFSGEPKTFPVIIKLLPLHAHDDAFAYGRFLNEEMFYSKMTAKYQLDIYPKCYVADMGRYGRPVVVLEDLVAAGYLPIAGKLDKNETKMCLNVIAGFVSRGLDIKRDQFSIFREFYSKLVETSVKENLFIESLNKTLDSIRQQPSSNIAEAVKTILDRVPEKFHDDDKLFTICHGNLTEDHLMFRYENGKPVDVKILGWNQMRYTLPGIDLQHIITNKLQQQIDKTIDKTQEFDRKYEMQLWQQLLHCYPYIYLDEIERICSNLLE